MKPRPVSGSWQNFLCRLLLVVIFLQGISAQPVPKQRGLSSPPVDRDPPSALLQQWSPPPHRSQQPLPSQHIRLEEKVHEISKNTHPVFLPFTVPIPWPTPFNGTDFAPLPAPFHPMKTYQTELSSDTNSLLILVPEFEFIPLYYNSPVVHTTSEHQSSVNVSPREKPAPKPSSHPKPSLKSQPKPISKPRPKPAPRSRSEAAQTLIKCPPVKPVRPLSRSPRPTSIAKTTKKLPYKPQPKPLDPVCEHATTSRGFVPPPKHTWTPPPENVPEYIPPSPSNLHTRSSESLSDQNGYETYDPRHYTLSDNGFYSPQTYTNTRYDPYRKEIYELYDPAFYDQTAYTTYGPDIVTFSEPTGDEDRFVTYGPDIVTYTEETDWTYPKRPSSHPQETPSKQSTYVTYGPDYETYIQPTQYKGGYIDDGPYTVTYTDDASVPSPAKPKRPSSHPPSSGQPSYVTYGPETETATDPATNDDEYITYGLNVAMSSDDYPVPPSPKPPAPSKWTPTSPVQPLPDQAPFIPHPTHGPHKVYIDEPTQRDGGYVAGVPGEITDREDATVSKRPPSTKPPRPLPQPPPPDQPSYVTYAPDRVVTEPTTPEDGYVIHASGVETDTENVPTPPFQRIPTSRIPQRSWKRPAVSRQPQKATTVESKSSKPPASYQPQEKEIGNVYYGPTKYTVYEEPNGDKAVVYESEIMEVHEDEPHLESPAKDPNVHYYELEPEYETYYEEEPQYYTVYEGEDDHHEN